MNKKRTRFAVLDGFLFARAIDSVSATNHRFQFAFLSATIAEGNVSLNQSDHLVVASNRMHVYEVRRRKYKRSVDLISDALPFGRLWYGESNAVSNAFGYAKHRSRSHDAVIRVYDEAGAVIETHESKGDFKEP